MVSITTGSTKGKELSIGLMERTVNPLSRKGVGSIPTLPTYGDYSVIGNTTVCGAVITESYSVSHPKTPQIRLCPHAERLIVAPSIRGPWQKAGSRAIRGAKHERNLQ